MRLFIPALVFVLVGCPGDGKGSATDEVEPGTAGGTSTAATTGTSAPTDEATTATSEAATGGATTGAACEETTGEPVIHDESCDPFCQRLIECGLEGLFDGCPCYGFLTGEKCLAQWDAAVECFAAESCAALDSGESPCWGQYEAAIERCLLGECGCSGYAEVGPDMGPDECIFGEECLDSPSRRIECDAQSCACTVDGVPAGTCPPGDVCDAKDFAEIEAKLDECCG
jgi:hypothetical protein